MVSAVIIDDDDISRKLLRSILKNTIGNIDLLGEAGSVSEGLSLIKQVNPELVFMDIRLPDGTGFDLLDRLNKIDFKIIFITAYREYAIKAFKYSAFDYIVKPIDIQELTRAVARIPKKKKDKNKVEVQTPKANLVSLSDNELKTIALPEQNGFAIVSVDKIIRCEGMRNYTRIIFIDGVVKVVSRTLLEFENLLTPLGFVRIHRSHLVNLVNVAHYIKSQGGSVELKTGEQLKVSSKYKDDLLNRLLFNRL